MTSRAPFYEGIEGPLHFPEPKSVDNPFHSFSVAFRLDFLLPLLLAVQLGDNLFPAHNQGRGSSGNYHTGLPCRAQKANFVSGSDL